MIINYNEYGSWMIVDHEWLLNDDPFLEIDEFYNDRYCDIKWLQKKRFKKIIKINKDK
jgi:hypothetical protein